MPNVPLMGRVRLRFFKTKELPYIRVLHGKAR